VSSYCALSPASAAVYAALNVSALTSLAPGGVSDDVAQNTVFPCVFYEVQESNRGGLGTKPGTTRLMEVELRVHVFTASAGLSEAQTIMAKVIELLKDPLTVTGYASAAIFHDETVPLSDEMVAGVRVKELVWIGRVFVSEA
jgi:hypothetical protein